LFGAPCGVSLIEPDMVNASNSFYSAPILRSHLSSPEERVWPALKLIPLAWQIAHSPDG